MFTIRMSIIVLSTVLLYACGKEPAANQSQVERGQYLVTFGGCHDCHTPKIAGPDGTPTLNSSRLLSGHPEKSPAPSWSPDDLQRRGVMATSNDSFTAWAGPWGVTFAINLTPDVETGIGEWSEEAFIQAARTGKHQGQPNGRDILPPMPWFNMKHLTDADLKAMWAYLRSLPPIKNRIPLPLLPSQSAAPAASQ